MKYIKLTCLAFLMAFMAYAGHAQDKMSNETRSKIEARRVAYLSDRLDLSVQEAEQFFPIYNEYNNEIKKIRNSRKSAMPKRDMSEKDAEDFLNQSLIYEESMIDLKRQYTRRMAQVISYKKTMRLFKAEQEFKREVLKKLKKRNRRAE